MLDGARQNADCMLYIPRIIIMGVCQNFCYGSVHPPCYSLKLSSFLTHAASMILPESTPGQKAA